MENAQLDELMHKLDELISSGGVTRRCVSLAQGTLSPDMRVNYEFGLVLGVNEFRQEQLYFLHKDYLHNRALHGYGTVAGLQVIPEAAGGGDVKLTVTPGIGIDQCGRAFVVRNPQCAFLSAWFERQQENPDASLQPGAKRLYVVATYDECPDALVSIAGQPCSSSQQNQVASRIRDSFQIALRWVPPAMPTWDAIQCFTELMADVRIEPDLPHNQSDKATIIDLVRLLDDCEAVRARRQPPAAYYPADYGYGGVGFDDTPRYLYLPAATAHQDLDDIFRVWVTEVRPRLQPDVIECGFGTGTVETGVLLAAMNVQLDYNNGKPLVTLLGPDNGIDDSGRPYLLSTQVIQELMTLGGTGGTALAQHEFATLSVRDNQSLLLWVHHPELLNLAGDLGTTLELFSDDAPLTGTVEVVTGFENVFVIRVNETIAAGARVELRFHLNTVRVGNASAADGSGLGLVTRPGIDPATVVERLAPAARNALRSLAETRAIAGSTPLLASIDLFGFDYVGRDDDMLTVYTIADDLPDVRAFVTITTLSEDLPRPELRLWFNTEAPLVVPTAAVEATRIRGTAETPFAFDMVQFGGGGTEGATLWILRPRQAVLQDGDQVRLRFDTAQIRVRGQQPLTTAMRQGQYTFVGYDGDRQIAAFHAIEIPTVTGGGISEEQVRELIRQVRTLPLATITPTNWNRENLADFELWFHPEQFVDQGEAKISDLNFRVYMEAPQAGQVVPVEIVNVDQFGGYHFNVQVNIERLFNFDNPRPTYARFVFPLDEGNIISNREGDFPTLREYMTKFDTKFDGYYAFEEETGREVLVIYVRFDPLILDPRG